MATRVIAEDSQVGNAAIADDCENGEGQDLRQAAKEASDDGDEELPANEKDDKATKKQEKKKKKKHKKDGKTEADELQEKEDAHEEDEAKDLSQSANEERLGSHDDEGSARHPKADSEGCATKEKDRKKDAGAKKKGQGGAAKCDSAEAKDPAEDNPKTPIGKP